MKVKIQQRSVYHKFAEVEIEIKEKDYQKYRATMGIGHYIQDYLLENEHLYVDKIDDAMSKASFEYGFGTDQDDWRVSPSLTESEWRFECNELKEAGHL